MTGFCDSESRSASVQLAAGTIYSEVRTFVAAHDSVKPSRILTTMPSHRIMPTAKATKSPAASRASTP